MTLAAVRERKREETERGDRQSNGETETCREREEGGDRDRERQSE